MAGKKNQKSIQQESQKSVILIWPAVIAVIYIAAAFLEGGRLWGINHLAFFDGAVIAVFAAMVILSFLPVTGKRLNDYVGRFHSYFHRGGIATRLLLSLIIFGISSAVFYILRTPTHFLGDGYLRADELTSGFSHLPLQTEPLSGVLHYFFYKLASSLWGLDNFQSLQLFSVLLGGAYIAVIVNIFKPDRKLPFSPLLFFAGLGGIQLYFGYIESYEILYLSLLVFLWASFEYLRSGKYFLTAVCAYFVAFFANFSVLYTFPAFLLILVIGIMDKGLKRSFKLSGVFALVLMLAGICYFHFIYVPGYGRVETGFLLPFGGEDYWILSGNHLLDIVNGLFLSGTIFVLLIPLIFRKKYLQVFSLRQKAFALVIALGAGAFLLFINPKLGFARDWDLFASTGICLSAIAFFLVYSNRDRLSGYSYFLRVIVALSLIFTASFVLVNHSRQKSIDRFDHILALYGERSALGYETLAGYYRNQPQTRTSMQIVIQNYSRAFELSNNPRYLVYMLQIYHQLFQANSDRQTRDSYASIIERLSNKYLEIDSSSTIAYNYLMVINDYRQNYEDAIAYSDSVLKYLEPAYVLQFRLERAGFFSKIGMLDSAIAEHKMIIKAEPSYSRSYAMIGNLYQKAGDIDNARKYYMEYLAKESDDSLRMEIKSILESLK
jgi:tetratricopeptide (TPR) repeat protein